MMNQLQAVALNEGLRCKKKLWREAGRAQLEAFKLAPWASQRRVDLLELLDRLNPTIAKLTQAIDREVEKCPAQRDGKGSGRPHGWPPVKVSGNVYCAPAQLLLTASRVTVTSLKFCDPTHLNLSIPQSLNPSIPLQPLLPASRGSVRRASDLVQTPMATRIVRNAQLSGFQSPCRHFRTNRSLTVM